MALTAIPKLQKSWFTPESQLEEDLPTRFEVKPLNTEQYSEVMMHFNADSGAISGKGLNMAIRFGLVGWENFSDPETGKEIKFNVVQVKRIPQVEYIEAAMHIIKISELSEADEKNS